MAFSSGFVGTMENQLGLSFTLVLGHDSPHLNVNNVNVNFFKAEVLMRHIYSNREKMFQNIWRDKPFKLLSAAINTDRNVIRPKKRRRQYKWLGACR